MVREGVSEEQRFSVKDAAVGGSGTGGRVHKEDDGGRDGTFRDIQASPAHGKVTRTGAEREEFREAS